MKPFIKTLTIFLLPVLLALFLPVFIITWSGEISDPNTLFAKQRTNKNALMGLAYSYPIQTYKLDGMNFIKPQVLIVGSSRVMQIRNYFFRSDVSFYNTGGMVGDINELNCFFNNIPVTHKPRIIVLGLDQFWFNNSFVTSSGKYDCSIAAEAAPSLQSLIKFNFTRIYKQLYKGDIKPGRLLSNNIGLSGEMNNEGFRIDGSYRYGKILTHPEEDVDYNFKDTYYRIANNTNRFQYGQDVSDSSVRRLDNFLSACYKQNIQVVAFLPSFPHVIIDTMMKMGEKYAYITKIMPALKPVFDKYKYALADFTDEAWLGSEPTEYIDGFHASEKAMLRALLALNHESAALNKYCDTTQMRKLLTEAKGPRNILND